MIEPEKIQQFLDNLSCIDRHNHIEVLELLKKLEINLPPLWIGTLFQCIDQQRQVERFIPLILTHGIYMEDLRDLSIANSEWLAPRLKLFKESLISTPIGLKMEQWKEILDKMIFAHEIHSKDNIKLTKQHFEEMEEGFKLYHKYYRDLWD